MSANEIHQNDIGTQFRCTIKDDTTPVDLSSASSLQLIFTKPTGAQLTKTAFLYTDGTDGIIYYNTVSGDLNEVGQWKIQARIVFSTGTWKSDIKRFKCHRNL